MAYFRIYSKSWSGLPPGFRIRNGELLRREIATNFRLLAAEKPADALRRIVTEQIDGAIVQLQRDDDLNKGIHEARKHLKRVRAALRLARGALPEKTYRRENAFFREQGRILSPVRDSAVYIETLDMLRKRYAAQLSGRAFTDMRRSFVERHRALLTTFVEDGSKLPVVISSLQEARLRAQGWRFNGKGFGLFARGLGRIYSRGRCEKQTAYGQPTTGNFHAWRKRVKYTRFHLQILQPLWPDLMAMLAREGDLLADNLGEEHDLALLEESCYVRELEGAGGGSAELFTALIARERERRRRAAAPLADRLYVETPVAFVNRVEGYWQAYRSHSLTNFDRC